MPIKLTKDFLKRSLYKKYIPSIDANVPTNEKIKIYDKKDPEIKACPKIFSIPRAKYSLDDKITRPSIRGRFAIPNLKKGRGFGINASISERKKHIDARIEILSDD